MRKPIIIMALLLIAATIARGQGCLTDPPPEATRWSASLDIPANVPGVTGTVSGAVSGGGGNHNLTVGPDTTVSFSWSSTNAASWTSWYTYDGGAKQPWIANNSSGSNSEIYRSADIGHTYVYTYSASDASGNSTIDRVTVTTVSGNSGIISSDGVASNAYLHVTSSLYGTPTVAADCSHSYMTSGATHNPVATVQLANLNSGESRAEKRMDLGPLPAMSNGSMNTISVNSDDWLSVLPQDLHRGGVQATVASWFICSSAGQEWEITISLVIEVAVTVSEINGPGVIRPGTGNPPLYRYPVVPWCEPLSTPPDWNPQYLDTPATIPGASQFWVGYTLATGPKVAGTVILWVTSAGLMSNVSPPPPPLGILWGLIHGVSAPYAPSAADRANGGFECTNYNNGTGDYSRLTIPLPPLF